MYVLPLWLSLSLILLVISLQRPDDCEEDLTTAFAIQGGRLLAASLETLELLSWEKALATRDSDAAVPEAAITTINLSAAHPHSGSIACLEAIGSAAFAVATTSGLIFLWSTHSTVAPYRTLKLPAFAGSSDGMHRKVRVLLFILH